MSEWISIKEEFPPLNEWILCYCPAFYEQKNIHVGMVESEGTLCDIGHNPDDYYGSRLARFTHWMPLPEQPKES